MITHKHYIPRMAEKAIAISSKYYPIISVMGPRQAGKTKMIQKYFVTIHQEIISHHKTLAISR